MVAAEDPVTDDRYSVFFKVKPIRSLHFLFLFPLLTLLGVGLATLLSAVAAFFIFPTHPLHSPSGESFLALRR